MSNTHYIQTIHNTHYTYTVHNTHYTQMQTHTHLCYIQTMWTQCTVNVCVSVQIGDLERCVNMLSLDVSGPINWLNKLIKWTNFTLVFTASELHWATITGQMSLNKMLTGKFIFLLTKMCTHARTQCTATAIRNAFKLWSCDSLSPPVGGGGHLQKKVCVSVNNNNN